MQFPTDDAQERMRAAARATRSAAGRSPARPGNVDNGTIALAISGMTFYWMMPLLAGRRRRRRRNTSGQQS